MDKQHESERKHFEQDKVKVESELKTDGPMVDLQTFVMKIYAE